MAVAQEFRDEVENRDLMMVRIMLKDSMIVDPTLREYDELVAYVEPRISDLYDTHDGEMLNYDRDTWTKSYMDTQMVAVVNNFSKERVELLKSIVKNVYGEKIKGIEQKRREERHTRSTTVSQKQVGTGLTASGIVIAAIGVCVSENIIVVAGAVAAIAGAVMVITDK